MQRRLQLPWNPSAVGRLLITPGLPRHAWLLQAGVELNFFGNGLVAPYLVIYLHFNRGIPLSLAALAIGSGGILATISGLVVGPLVDRVGPRTCVAIAMSANAVAYAAYTQVHVFVSDIRIPHFLSRTSSPMPSVLISQVPKRLWATRRSNCMVE